MEKRRASVSESKIGKREGSTQELNEGKAEGNETGRKGLRRLLAA